MQSNKKAATNAHTHIDSIWFVQLKSGGIKPVFLDWLFTSIGAANIGQTSGGMCLKYILHGCRYFKQWNMT